MTPVESTAETWKGTEELEQGLAESTVELLDLLSHVQRGRMDEQRCLLDPKKAPSTPKPKPAHGSIGRSYSDGRWESPTGNEMDRLCDTVSRAQGSRMDEQRCSGPQTFLAPGSPLPPGKAHSRPASPTGTPSSQRPPGSASLSSTPDKERHQRDSLHAAQGVAPDTGEQEQFFSMLSHVQKGRMEEQRCVFDPNKTSTCTPKPPNTTKSVPTQSSMEDVDQLFSTLAKSQSHRLDDQRVSLNLPPGSGSDQKGQGNPVAGKEADELYNMVSRLQGSRMDEQRCSGPQTFLGPGSPPPPGKAHSRPASPTGTPSSQRPPGSASLSSTPDKERVQRDGLHAAQQEVAAGTVEQEQFFSMLSHVQRGRMEEQRCVIDPNKRSNCTPTHSNTTKSGSGSDQKGQGNPVAGKEADELYKMVSRLQGSRMDEQRCSGPQTFLGPGSPPPPGKAHSRPASPTGTPSSQRPPGSASLSSTPDKERVQRDSLHAAQQEVAAGMGEQEQFFSMLSHVQRGRMEEQRCVFDPNKRSTCTPNHPNTTKSVPTQSSMEHVVQLLSTLAKTQSHWLDDQRVSLNLPPGSGSDQKGQGKPVAGQEADELYNMVSRLQGSRMDEQRCSGSQTFLGPGSPPPPWKAHSRPASPTGTPSSQRPPGSASLSSTPDKERVQRDSLHAAQQEVGAGTVEQEQFFSMLSHVQRGRMEEQRCVFDPNKRSTCTPNHPNTTKSVPTQSSMEDIVQLFSTLAKIQSHRLDDQRVSLNLPPGSGSDQEGQGNPVAGKEADELYNMVSRLQGSRMDEQRCSGPQTFLGPGSPPPPGKAHSRPTSLTGTPSSQRPPGAASLSSPPDKEKDQRDGLHAAQQEVAAGTVELEQFFSMLNHVQRGRMEEQRCVFDPNKRSTCAPNHPNTTKSVPTQSSMEHVVQLLSTLAKTQSHWVDDQRVSLNLPPGSGSDQKGQGNPVAGKEADELYNMVSRLQGSRMDEQRCSGPQTSLGPGSPPPPGKAHCRPASPTGTPSSQRQPGSASLSSTPDKERVQRDGLHAAQQEVGTGTVEQEQFFSMLSHVQRGRMEEQRCVIDPNKRSACTPTHSNTTKPVPTQSSTADIDHLFSILANTQSHRLDDQRASLNLPPGSGSDQKGQGNHVAGKEGDELYNMVSRLQGSRMDEQRCSGPQTFLGPGSPPPPGKAHSRPASPTGTPSSQRPPGTASLSSTPDKERVQRDGLHAAQQGVAPGTVEQEQFFSMLSHVQRGRMEEQRCVFDANKTSTCTPNHANTTTSVPTQSSTADIDHLFSILANTQSHRLDDQRASLNLPPGSGSDQKGQGKPVAGNGADELYNMVARIQGSRLDVQRCPGPQTFLAPGSPLPPGKAHSRPASPTGTPSSQRPPGSAALSRTPDKVSLQRDGLHAAQGVPSGMVEQEEFFSILGHVQRGRMEEQRCVFDPNKNKTSTPKHTIAKSPALTESSTADIDQLYSILANKQSHRLDDQRVSLDLLPGLHGVSCSDQKGQGKPVAGKEADELYNMVSRIQGSRIEEQRCSLPVVPSPRPPRSATMSTITLESNLHKQDHLLSPPNPATSMRSRSRSNSPSRATPKKSRSRPNSPNRARGHKSRSRANSPSQATPHKSRSRPPSPNTVQHVSSNPISPNDDCLSLIHRVHEVQPHRGEQVVVVCRSEGGKPERGREKRGGGEGGKREGGKGEVQKERMGKEVRKEKK